MVGKKRLEARGGLGWLLSPTPAPVWRKSFQLLRTSLSLVRSLTFCSCKSFQSVRRSILGGGRLDSRNDTVGLLAGLVRLMTVLTLYSISRSGSPDSLSSPIITPWRRTSITSPGLQDAVGYSEPNWLAWALETAWGEALGQPARRC